MPQLTRTYIISKNGIIRMKETSKDNKSSTESIIKPWRTLNNY